MGKEWKLKRRSDKIYKTGIDNFVEVRKYPQHIINKEGNFLNFKKDE